MNKKFWILLLILLCGLLAACGRVAASESATASPSSMETAVSTTVQPLTELECNDLRDAVVNTLGVAATLNTADFTDIVSGQTGTGCQITVSGTGETFSSFLDVAKQLQDTLSAMGWTPDMAYLADGPTGTATGLRLDDKLALINVDWQPSPDANCPADQIITACELSPAQQIYTITLNFAQVTAA